MTADAAGRDQPAWRCSSSPRRPTRKPTSPQVTFPHRNPQERGEGWDGGRAKAVSANHPPSHAKRARFSSSDVALAFLVEREVLVKNVQPTRRVRCLCLRA